MSILTKNIGTFNYAYKVMPYTYENCYATSSTNVVLTPGSILELILSSSTTSFTISDIVVDGADGDNFAIGELRFRPYNNTITWPSNLTWLEDGEEGSAPTLESDKTYHFTICQDNQSTILINLAYSYTARDNN